MCEVRRQRHLTHVSSSSYGTHGLRLWALKDDLGAEEESKQFTVHDIV
jgi:hypothetical protein